MSSSQRWGSSVVVLVEALAVGEPTGAAVDEVEGAVWDDMQAPSSRAQSGVA
jgi:hypothetical protein